MSWRRSPSSSPATHLAPRGAKNEQAFAGGVRKVRDPQDLFAGHSGPPVFTFKHKIEALSLLRPSFAHSGPPVFTF